MSSVKFWFTDAEGRAYQVIAHRQTFDIFWLDFIRLQATFWEPHWRADLESWWSVLDTSWAMHRQFFAWCGVIFDVLWRKTGNISQRVIDMKRTATWSFSSLEVLRWCRFPSDAGRPKAALKAKAAGCFQRVRFVILMECRSAAFLEPAPFASFWRFVDLCRRLMMPWCTVTGGACARRRLLRECARQGLSKVLVAVLGDWNSADVKTTFSSWRCWRLDRKPLQSSKLGTPAASELTRTAPFQTWRQGGWVEFVLRLDANSFACRIPTMLAIRKDGSTYTSYINIYIMHI